MRSPEQVQLRRPCRRTIADGGNRGEIRRDGAPTARYETADVDELDSGSKRCVVRVE
jgi:hypothetical protein